MPAIYSFNKYNIAEALKKIKVILLVVFNALLQLIFPAYFTRILETLKNSYNTFDTARNAGCRQGGGVKGMCMDDDDDDGESLV